MPSRSELVIGTLCTVTLYNRGNPRVYKEIFGRLKAIDNKMSLYIEGSEINDINKAAGIRPVMVSPDVFEVIETALLFAALSDGAFDPTIGPLVKLWDIGGENQRVPSQEEIDEVLPLVNWRDVELNRNNSTVFLRNPGMILDLGAIAKGYAADEAAVIIRNERIPMAIIDLGGNILLVGARGTGTLWRIGIQDPLDDRGAYTGIVQTQEKSIVTSGVYERFFIDNNIIYHHLFSPVNGYPVRNNLMSTTIITDRSINADALSTAVFVMGYERGRALVESLEDVACIFVFNDHTIRVVGDVDFILYSRNYRIE